MNPKIFSVLVLPAKTWKNRKVRVNKTWRDKKTKWGRGALWLVKVGSGLPTSSLSKNISALFKFENKEFDHCKLGPHYGVYGTDYTVRYNRPVKLSEKRSERNTSKSIEILGWILRERTQKLLKNFAITEQKKYFQARTRIDVVRYKLKLKIDPSKSSLVGK